MVKELTRKITVEKFVISSTFLRRNVVIDCYVPAASAPAELSLLLVNDGQDLVRMPFEDILENLLVAKQIEPIFCVGIHCAADRKNEYGTAFILDYKGRGAKSLLFNFFIFKELLPLLMKRYPAYTFKDKSYAGFSLGGLSALDIVWNHAEEFKRVGVFSGSLWWRDRSADDKLYDEETDRIMHRQISEGAFKPWLKFFFEVGTEDEVGDRNNNGIIDSIDDTISLIDVLQKKGYSEENIGYLELQNGRHDVPTWAMAFPTFLTWGWGLGETIYPANKARR